MPPTTTAQLPLFASPVVPLAARTPSTAEGQPDALARARKNRYRAAPCVVLGVDTATVSGWALRACGKLLLSGQCRATDADELDTVITDALDVARRHQLPLALVLERAFGHRTQVLLALGAARGAWLAAWKRARQPRTRVVSVYPMTWRAAVGANLPRQKRVKGAPRSWDQIRAKRAAQERLELVLAQSEVDRNCQLQPDEAAAILISRWAAYAPNVSAVCRPSQRQHRR